MSSLSTDYLKINKTIAFYNNIVNENSIYYIFTGKPSPWGLDSYSLETVPTPLINFYSLKNELNDIIALKRIKAEDVSLAIKRYDWNQGFVYDQYNIYDDNLLRKNHYVGKNPFYVITDEYNVYKCLDNNNGAQSIEQPSGQFLTPFTLSDGYRWKFMFNVSEVDRIKFLSTGYIPLKGNFELISTMSQYNTHVAAVPGSIERFDILSSGSGFYDGTTDLVFSGSGTNLAGNIVLSGTSVSRINITNPGRDYTTCSVSITSNAPNPTITPQVRPQFAPQGGHGYNCLTELGAFYTIISVDIVGDEDVAFPLNSYFRKTGIVQNFKDIQGNFTVQDYFYGPQNPLYNNGSLRASSASKILDPASGEVCYINYHEKIQRKSNHLERIKLVVETN